LFGYGCVGQGLHDVLNSSSGFKADIVRICVKDRKLFGFQEVSEYFSSESNKYVIGVVNLETLYRLREQLRNMDVFIVNTGRKS